MVRLEKVDASLGARLRRMRIRAGISQSDVGKVLGCTYQQVQKYEAGTNRISLVSLVRISRFYKKSVNELLEDVDIDSISDCVNYTLEDIQTLQKPELELINAYRAINDPIRRSKILELVKTISDLDHVVDNDRYSEKASSI